MNTVNLKHSHKYALHRGQVGQGMVEYALMLALIGITLIIVMGVLEDVLVNTFADITMCGDALTGRDCNESSNGGSSGGGGNSFNSNNSPNSSSSPLTAKILYSCTLLTCQFNGGNSTPNSSIVSYAWSISDGFSSTTKTTNRTFTVPGTYEVTLTVTNNVGETNTATKTVTASASLWIDNIDAPLSNGISGNGNKWTLKTISFHVVSSTGAGVASATITMSDGKSCTTDNSGSCNITGYNILLNAASDSTAAGAITISSVVAGSYTYQSDQNKNTDGDGNTISGNAITITNPK